MILRRAAFSIVRSASNFNPQTTSIVNPTLLAFSRSFSSQNNDKILIRFVTNDKTYEVPGNIGESLLDVVTNNDVPLDGFGACEGTLACCTCHVILGKEHFDRLAKPEEEELDMLDLAPELTDESRLGCQVILNKDDRPSITVHVPSVKIDARTAS